MNLRDRHCSEYISAIQCGSIVEDARYCKFVSSVTSPSKIIKTAVKRGSPFPARLLSLTMSLSLRIRNDIRSKAETIFSLLHVSGKTRTPDKYRVVYTDHQRLELEKEYQFSKYITIRRKAELAQALSLSERQVGST